MREDEGAEEGEKGEPLFSTSAAVTKESLGSHLSIYCEKMCERDLFANM